MKFIFIGVVLNSYINMSLYILYLVIIKINKKPN